MKPSLPLSVSSSASHTALKLVQAQRLHLAAQGLLNKPKSRAKPADVVAAVTRMRLLQIDSIHVVARSPYLVLHSRLGDYEPQWLEDALEAGRIAESWAHEACFVPATDLALHQAWRMQRSMHWASKHADRMHREHRDGMDGLLARIRDNGAARGGFRKRNARRRWLVVVEAGKALAGSVVRARRIDGDATRTFSARIRCRDGPQG